MRVPRTTLEPDFTDTGDMTFRSVRGPRRFFVGGLAGLAAVVFVVGVEPHRVGYILGGVMLGIALLTIVYEAFGAQLTFLSATNQVTLDRTFLGFPISSTIVAYAEVRFSICTYASVEFTGKGQGFAQDTTPPECTVELPDRAYVLDISRGQPVTEKHLADFKTRIGFVASSAPV